MNKLITLFLAPATVLAVVVSCGKDNGDPKSMTVTDIDGNTYGTVQIGNQIWMAENLACTRYDTESERAGEYILQGIGENDAYTPYYVDSRVKENWTDNGKFADKITDEQIKRLGLLYNWAAAMGFTAEEAWNQVDKYDGDRQGICPNGWHLPSRDELEVLELNVAATCGDTRSGFEGKHLKSATGWHSDGSGTDDLAFCLLPAGGSDGKQIINVGYYTHIWSSTARTNDKAFDDQFVYNTDDIQAFYSLKKNARSVRCIKDSEQ